MIYALEKRYAARALTVLLFCCLLFSSPASVSAHAYIVASSPGENEVLEEAPASVSITFNEPIENAFHSLQVTDPSGQQAVIGESRIDDANPARLIADLRPELPEGIYTVNYKVLSSDGHAITGTFPFIIGDAAAKHNLPASNEFGSGGTDDWPGAGLLIVRWFQYSGLAIYMGVLLFHLFLLPRRSLGVFATVPMDGKAPFDGSAHPEHAGSLKNIAPLGGSAPSKNVAPLGDASPSDSKDKARSDQLQSARLRKHLEGFAKSSVWQRSQRLLLLSLLLTATGIGLSLPQQTAIDAGVPWSQAWSPALINETLSHTSFGKAWIAEMALLLLLTGLTAVFAAFAGKQGRFAASWTAAAALLASLGILLAKSFIGHAAAASGRSMAIAMNFLHQASSFLWLGGLLALAFLLPAAAGPLRNEPDAKRGVYWETIRRFSMLAAGCVTVLLCSGLYASLLHVPTWHALLYSNYGQILLAKAGLTLVMLALGFSAFLRGRTQSRPLGTGVWIEFAAGLIVLILAAILSNMPTALASPGPIQLKAATADGYHITVGVTPNTVGENRFEVTVLDPEQNPLDSIEQITLTLTSRDMDMGAIELTLPGDGTAPLNGTALVTRGGSWRLNVHVLLSSLDTIDKSFTFQVGTR